MLTCTRRLEFDYGHRLVRHEGKCAHLHGHRGVVEITCAAELDAVGRVIDFSEISRVVGGWIGEELDHAFIADAEDVVVLEFLRAHTQKHYVLQCPPSAENLARHIGERARSMLAQVGVSVTHVRFYETPNGWADWQ